MDQQQFELILNNPPNPKISVGVEYRIVQHRGDGGVVAKYYRALKVYESHVVFETEQGYRESFTWWELARLIT